jgi:hypothetical protein
MAPTTSEPRQQELVEKYIELDAMSRVLHVLVGNWGVPDAPDSPHAATVFGPPWVIW